MFNTFQKLYSDYRQKKPLTLVLVLGLLFRGVAVILSKGFGMHDDHFLVIEVAQGWLDNMGYWLDKSLSDEAYSGQNLLYPGLHYVLFMALESIGLTNPQGKMYVVRAIHALLSLIPIWATYKTVLLIHQKETAFKASLLMAILWVMPFLSVHNFVETFSIIPLSVSLLMFTQGLQQQNNTRYFIFAGVLCLAAFAIRYQTLIFAGGLGLYLLIRQQWKSALFFSLGGIIGGILFYGSFDLLVFGEPFYIIKRYVGFNATGYGGFPQGHFFTFILVLLGIMLPPMGLLYFWGFLTTYKKYLHIFLPATLFLLFHSVFPNKQERFIFPILNWFIILCVVGWEDFRQSSTFWQNKTKLLNILITVFWVMNIPLLIIFSSMYSKQSRVESMVYLSEQPHFDAFVIEQYVHDKTDKNATEFFPFQPPMFYLKAGGWKHYYSTNDVRPVEELKTNIKADGRKPSYLLFVESEDIPQRLERYKALFPKLTYQTTIEPSFMDKFIHWLNPVNKNQTVLIYKIEEINLN